MVGLSEDDSGRVMKMLPNLPEVERFAGEYLRHYLRMRVVHKTGFMQAMRQPEVILEGNKAILQRYDGTIDNVPMRCSGAKMTIRLDDLEERGLSAVLDAIEQVATEMANQQTKHFTTRLDEICEESGQVFDAKGQPLTFDTLLGLLETIDIDFDEQGQPRMPTIMAGSSIIEKFKNFKPTDEQNERYDEIIERKYSEWRDRESDRRLVD